MECSNSIAFLEFDHVITNGLNDTGDVISRVVRLAILRSLPVFGIGSREDDLDQDLIGRWLWNGNIVDGDLS